MKRWERIEAYLFDYDKLGTEFTCLEYAAAEGLDSSEASGDIQSYLYEQRKRPWKNMKGEWVGHSKALFELRRVKGTRTANARWAVGAKTKDAVGIGLAFSDDTLRKWVRATERDLLHLRDLNPHAAKRVEKQLKLVSHAMALLEEAAEGID